MTSIKNFFKQLVTLIPVFISFVFFVLFFIIEVFKEGFINNNLIAFGVVVGFPMFIGIILFVTTRKGIQKDNEVRVETRIIEFCATKGGKFTVPDVAIHFGLTLDESSERLKGLQEKGYFEMELTEKGAIIYKLLNFVDPIEKRSSRSVI